MLRTALIWLTVAALALGGIALPANASHARADGAAGMGGMGGDDHSHALPVTVRAQALAAQWQPAGPGSASDDAITVDVPAWRVLRVLPDAPASRPVPIVPSDPEAPGTGAVVS
jgi:hypothetical protein